MERPKDPNALIGSIVQSNRDPDKRQGRIQRLGDETLRPFVYWDGNRSAIVCEWQHIEIQNQPCSEESVAILQRIFKARPDAE
jgi:hypothetical protein